MASHAHNRRRPQAWVIDVNMGYGHSRAAHALRDLSSGGVITANAYRGIPDLDRDLWSATRKGYEFLSRLKPIPVIGNLAFDLLDRMQLIPDFYPRRDLSAPSLQLRESMAGIKRGLCRHLIETLAREPLPIVATFPVPALAADYYNYPGEIYCVTTDTDVNRAWVPEDPKGSRIKYFASNGRVVERLKLYGVPEQNIFLTGFPLPKSLIGGTDAARLKPLLAQRLCNLDPNGIFHERYARILEDGLGTALCQLRRAAHPLTVTYSVGGAGAQRRLGVDIMRSLRRRIARHEVRLNLVAGTRKDVARYYASAAADLGLRRHMGDWLVIPSYDTRVGYFEGFDKLLETTDILWTKPSELSFYTGLGIAIVMAPTVGSQEDFNRLWLQYVGGGVSQFEPEHADEWLFDWIASGGVARLAWNGYAEAPTHGTYRIEDIVLGRKSEVPMLPLIV
jgi:hypothetical protein